MGGTAGRAGAVRAEWRVSDGESDRERKLATELGIAKFAAEKGFSTGEINKALESFRELRDGNGAPVEAAPVFPLRWYRDLDQVTPRAQVVKGLLLQGSLFLVFGESNSGKSFWLLDLSLKVAAGALWRGRRTCRGMVLYVAAESSYSMQERVAAYRQEHPDVAAGLPFAVLGEAVNLLNAESVEKLISTIRAAESECGERVSLVIFDTFARSMPGGDENSAEDVGSAVAAADAIRAATGATVGFIHHVGKDASKGARGSSALRAAVDTEVLVEGTAGKRLVSVTKQRDLPSRDLFAFELRNVVLGRDEDGEAVSSCVVDAADVPDAPAVVRLKGANKVRLFAALKEWRSANPNAEILSSIELVRVAKAQGLDRRRRHEAVSSLVAEGVLVATVGGHLLVTEGFTT